MSYSKEFMEYVAEQMRFAGEITYKLMFGAYSIYLNGKLIGIAGENQVFIKPTVAGKEVMPNLSLIPPYEGAKPYFLVEDLDDAELLGKFLTATYSELFSKVK